MQPCNLVKWTVEW